jgi:uncharacterized protein YndB with AHSA1/START domain
MNMKNEPLIIEYNFNAPAIKIWKALTNKNQMKQWYFDISPKDSSIIGFKAEVGFEFQFEGTGKDGKRFLHLCKITEVEYCKKLTYGWRFEGYEGNSFVTFELFAGGENQSRLKLTHSGLETFPQTTDFAKQNFVDGWTYIIGKSLKEFLEMSTTKG